MTVARNGAGPLSSYCAQALFLVLAITSATAACSAADSEPDAGSGLHSLQLQLEFRNREELPIPRRLLPHRPLLIFYFATGSVWLSRAARFADLGRFRGFGPFDIDGRSWTAIAQERSEPASYLPEGLSIAPAETKIGRVFAVAYAAGGRLGMRVVGEQQQDSLVVEGSTEHGLLIYFDRPCRIFRPVGASVGNIDVDIEIETPGFHLLTFIDQPNSRPRLVAEAAPAVIEATLVLTVLEH